jgi:hypothetical protein
MPTLHRWPATITPTFADCELSEDIDIVFRERTKPLTPAEISAKHQRIEAHAIRYIEGENIHIQTAVFRGPFDHWSSPWRTRGTMLGSPEPNNNPAPVAISATGAGNRAGKRKSVGKKKPAQVVFKDITPLEASGDLQPFRRETTQDIAMESVSLLQKSRLCRRSRRIQAQQNWLMRIDGDLMDDTRANVVHDDETNSNVTTPTRSAKLSTTLSTSRRQAASRTNPMPTLELVPAAQSRAQHQAELSSPQPPATTSTPTNAPPSSASDFITANRFAGPDLPTEQEQDMTNPITVLGHGLPDGKVEQHLPEISSRDTPPASQPINKNLKRKALSTTSSPIPTKLSRVVRTETIGFESVPQASDVQVQASLSETEHQLSAPKSNDRIHDTPLERQGAEVLASRDLMSVSANSRDDFETAPQQQHPGLGMDTESGTASSVHGQEFCTQNKAFSSRVEDSNSNPNNIAISSFPERQDSKAYSPLTPDVNTQTASVQARRLDTTSVLNRQEPESINSSSVAPQPTRRSQLSQTRSPERAQLRLTDIYSTQDMINAAGSETKTGAAAQGPYTKEKTSKKASFMDFTTSKGVHISDENKNPSSREVGSEEFGSKGSVAIIPQTWSAEKTTSQLQSILKKRPSLKRRLDANSRPSSQPSTANSMDQSQASIHALPTCSSAGSGTMMAPPSYQMGQQMFPDNSGDGGMTELSISEVVDAMSSFLEVDYIM